MTVASSLAGSKTGDSALSGPGYAREQCTVTGIRPTLMSGSLGSRSARSSVWADLTMTVANMVCCGLSMKSRVVDAESVTTVSTGAKPRPDSQPMGAGLQREYEVSLLVALA